MKSIETPVQSGLAIIKGLAEQIQKDASKPEFNEARARTILRYVEELEAAAIMLKQLADKNGHLGARTEE